MIRIVLIGTGNLGKRYIQAISRIAGVELFLYDKSEEALQSVDLFVKTNNINNLRYTSLNFFSETIDCIDHETIVIVATTANNRRQLLEDIIKINPKAIICEKPVTQNNNDYLGILNLLKVNKVRTFVDFTLRMQPFYQKLKSEIGNAENGIFFVNLPKTGLACVGIHQIDLFFWLFNLKSCNITNSSFSEIYEQKRAGFYDITGSLELTYKRFKGFINNSSYENVRTAEIIVNNYVYNIFEDQRIMTRINKEENKLIKTEIIDYAFVSQYMTEIISNIINNNYGAIKLPSIEDSYYQHKILFDYLENHSIDNLNFS